MQGRSKFTRQEAEEIKRILNEKASGSVSTEPLRGQLSTRARGGLHVTRKVDVLERLEANGQLADRRGAPVG